MARSIVDIFARLLADDTGFEADVVKKSQRAGDKAGMSMGQAIAAGVSRSATDIGRTLGNIGQNLSRTGRSLTTNLTLPILAAGAAVTHFALDFDTTMRRVVGLTDVTQEEIGDVREAILALGPAVGKGPQELGEAFYFIASAGFKANEALEVLETSAKASAAGLGDTQTIAQVLGGVINAYGRENITAARAADILTEAVSQGTAEASGLASVIGNVVPGAAALGVSFDQVTAAMAGMTLTGVGVEESATSLIQIFASLLKPTTQAEDALRGMGLSSAELRRQLREEGLLATLRTLEERFAGNETAAAAVFGNIRALRGVTALLTLDSEQLNAVFAKVEDSVGRLGEAYDETEGPQRELDRAMAEMQATAIELGQDVLPLVVDVFKELAAGARELGTWWRSLDDDTKKQIVQWLALVAALGPVLLIVGKIVSVFGALFRAVGFLAGPKGLATLPARLSAFMRVAGRIAPLLLLIDTLLKLPDVFDAVGDAIDAFGKKAPRQMLSAIRRILGAIPEPFRLPFMEQALDEIERQIEEFDAKTSSSEGLFAGWGPRGPIAQRVEDGVDLIATILEDGSVVVGDAADVGIGDPIAEAIAQARLDAAEETRKLIQDVATVLSTAPEELKDELDAFFEGLGEPFDEASRLADLEGQAARQEWIDAFTRGDPQAQAAAFEKFSTEILAQLELLLPDVFGAGAVVPTSFMSGVAGAVPAAIEALKASGRLGEFTSAFDLAAQLEALGEPVLAAYVRGMELERVTAGLKSGALTDLTEAFDLADALEALGDTAGATHIRSLAAGLERERAGTLRTQLLRNRNDIRQQMAIDLSAQGKRAIETFGDGLVQGQNYMYDRLGNIMKTVKGFTEFAESPPYTAIKKIGANVGRFWLENIIGSVRAGLPELASMLGNAVGAMELAPGMTGLSSYPAQNLTTPVPSLETTPGGAPSTVQNTWILNVNGVPYTFNNRDDFIRALDDLSAFGDGRVSGG